jgi:undecaprenyl-diphosphatase
LFSIDDTSLFAVGSIVSFISAFLAVRGLIRFISRHDFTVFAWYRIAFGILVLSSAHFGWVDWSNH